MLKNAILFLSAGLLCGHACAQPPDAVLPGGRQSLGFSASYAPDSSHILIGQAEQRRTWTAAVEYTRLLHLGKRLRWDYEGSVVPLYWESDPTLTGTVLTINRLTLVATQTPVRVVRENRSPIGEAITVPGNVSAPIYATYGRESTFAAGLSPLGARLAWMPRRRIQPSLALNLGFVVSPRDIPVDDTDRFNFMFAFGPGVRVFLDPRTSVRFEYIYHHISNAYMGNSNPGVDQGFVRLTFSRYW